MKNCNEFGQLIYFVVLYTTNKNSRKQNYLNTKSLKRGMQTILLYGFYFNTSYCFFCATLQLAFHRRLEAILHQTTHGLHMLCCHIRVAVFYTSLWHCCQRLFCNHSSMGFWGKKFKLTIRTVFTPCPNICLPKL